MFRNSLEEMYSVLSNIKTSLISTIRQRKWAACPSSGTSSSKCSGIKSPALRLKAFLAELRLGATQASRKDEIMDFPHENGWCFIQNPSSRKNLCMISTCLKLISCPPLVLLLLPFLQAIPLDQWGLNSCDWEVFLGSPNGYPCSRDCCMRCTCRYLQLSYFFND